MPTKSHADSILTNDDIALTLRLEELVVGGGGADGAEIEKLIASLAAANVRFRGFEQGLWLSVYPRPNPLSVRKNAGQDFDASKGRVVNYAEIAGQAAYFSERGNFAEDDPSAKSW